MSLHRNQQGFGHLVAFLIIATVLAVGVVGYRVSRNATATTTPSNPVVSNAVPKTLKTKADLTKADKSLDATPIDSSVNPNQLDNDLNSLL